jgi:periplasmic divalent cation tolerance protein
MDYIVVFCTTPDAQVAEDIARTIVEEGFAGCVNIVPSVRSFYTWEGRLQEDSEALMIIKTKKKLFQSLERRIKDLHPYSVAEIISIDITEGAKEYLDWLGSVTY